MRNEMLSLCARLRVRIDDLDSLSEDRRLDEEAHAKLKEAADLVRSVLKGVLDVG